jgi:hypothetical protein
MNDLRTRGHQPTAPAEVLSRTIAYPGRVPGNRWFKWSGEKRPPKQGEFFLSGAIIEAWETPADFPELHYIAVEIPPPVCTRCNQRTRLLP